MISCVPQVYTRQELGYTTGIGEKSVGSVSTNAIHFIASNVSQLALPMNTKRKSYLLRNQGADTVYVSFGSQATINDLQLQPNEYLGIDQQAPQDAIYILGSVGGESVYVSETA